LAGGPQRRTGSLDNAAKVGTGAEVQKPLATVVIATLLTLVVLPVLYKRYALTDATLQEITRKERSEFATSADTRPLALLLGSFCYNSRTCWRSSSKSAMMCTIWAFI